MFSKLFILQFLFIFLYWGQSFTLFHCKSPATSTVRLLAGKFLQVDPDDPNFRQKRIFVSNLPPHVDWRLLKDYFMHEFGDNVIYASISEDFRTGVSKGCGLVQFQTVQDAQRAIETMNGNMFDGYSILIREDKQTREGSTYNKYGENRKKIKSSDLLFREQKGGKQRTEQYINMRFKERMDRSRQPQEREDQDAHRNVVHSQSEVRKIVPKEEFLSQPYLIDESASETALRKIPGLEARNEIITMIQSSIDKREEARKNKDFVEADQLRSMLREKFKVQCDDRNRSWRILNTEK